MSSVTMLAFVDVPDAADPSGFAVNVYARSLLYGVNIDHDIQLVKRTRKASRLAPPTGTESINVQDKAAVKAAVKRVMAPPLVGSKESKAAAIEAGVTDWMKAASKRAYVIFQLLSMLPMKHRVSARGNGEAVLSGPLMAASTRIKQEAKGAYISVHRDAVIHHWFRENARLKLHDVTVPLVILH